MKTRRSAPRSANLFLPIRISLPGNADAPACGLASIVTRRHHCAGRDAWEQGVRGMSAGRWSKGGDEIERVIQVTH